jgi:hypothetical protein
MTRPAPGTFRIERSAVVDAAPDAIFPLIDDFRAWTGWSPWEKLDPNMSRTYSGPSHGKGAAYDWEGKKSGSGGMRILESSPGRKIAIQLAFLKPFAATNLAEFTFEPQGAGTRVTWAMSGRHTVLTRLFHAMGMEKMTGKAFEAGLADLKALAEKGRAHAPA